MKKTIKMSALALMMSIAAVSCKKKKANDTELTSRATAVVATYPGASVVVQEGTAHLSGTFADEATKNAAIADLRKVEGVQDVMDMANVVPVPSVDPMPMNSAVDPSVVQRTQDALKDYPNVKAEVVSGRLTLTGTATPDQARQIKMSVDALNIGAYDNQIIVK